MKKYPPSIITDDFRMCHFCGSPYDVEVHHCLYGTGERKLSTKYGLVMPLCAFHHRDYKGGVHGLNKILDRQIKQLAQKRFEAKYGHEQWMKVFGRNYITEVSDEIHG